MFLDAFTVLYERVCLSVRRSIGQSVRQSVRRSLGIRESAPDRTTSRPYGWRKRGKDNGEGEEGIRSRGRKEEEKGGYGGRGIRNKKSRKVGRRMEVGEKKTGGWIGDRGKGKDEEVRREEEDNLEIEESEKMKK